MLVIPLNILGITRMEFQSEEELQLYQEFLRGTGLNRINSFRQYEFRPNNLADQELFVLFQFQQEQVFAADRGAPQANDNLQAIHNNLVQAVSFQLGLLNNLFHDDLYQIWQNEASQWINSLHTYNNKLSRQIIEEGLSETRADELLLCKYFSELHIKIGLRAFNLSKNILGDEYETSEWYTDLNWNMRNLSSNAKEVGKKRNCYL